MKIEENDTEQLAHFIQATMFESIPVSKADCSRRFEPTLEI